MVKKRGFSYPKRAPVAILSIVIVFGSLIGVGHFSGSSLIQTTGILISACLVALIISPYFVLRNVKIQAIDVPQDVTVGSFCNLYFRSNSSVEITAAKISSNKVQIGKHSTTALVITFSSRGVISSLVLKVSTSAPFGIVWWQRKVEVIFSRPIYIHPKLGSNIIGKTLGEGTQSGQVSLRSSRSGLVKGVREYIIGDEPSSIHWPATAHTGKLMVKERDAEVLSNYLIDLTESREISEQLYEDCLYSVSCLCKKQEAPNITIRILANRQVLERQIATVKEAGRLLAQADHYDKTE